MHQDIERILFTKEEIDERCIVLGKQIADDYTKEGRQPLLVALLKGSIPFLSTLMQSIPMDLRFDVVDVSSYEGSESTGKLNIRLGIDYSLEGMSVLLVEDIVDTGRTLSVVKQRLMDKGADEVKVVTLLDKPSRRVVDLKPDYCGWEVENEFVVGYGLDFNQKYRNLPYVGVLKREIYE